MVYGARREEKTHHEDVSAREDGGGGGVIITFLLPLPSDLTWVHLSVIPHTVGVYNVLEAGGELVGPVEGGRFHFGWYISQNWGDDGPAALLQWRRYIRYIVSQGSEGDYGPL